MIYCLVNFKGFTTDGEWSTLRTKGNHQPLSIFQIRSDARAKYARMKLQKMTKMITPLRKCLALINILTIF